MTPNLALTLITLATLLISAQASWCLGQGPGYCNLNIEGSPHLEDQGYKYIIVWTRINIYDSGCNLIGYLNTPIEGVAIDSQLPYTVDMVSLTNGNQNFGFCYAGTCYTSGYTCQNSDQGGTSAVECLRAFPCPTYLERTAKQGRRRSSIGWKKESGFG